MIGKKIRILAVECVHIQDACKFNQRGAYLLTDVNRRRLLKRETMRFSKHYDKRATQQLKFIFTYPHPVVRLLKLYFRLAFFLLQLNEPFR